MNNFYFYCVFVVFVVEMRWNYCSRIVITDGVFVVVTCDDSDLIFTLHICCLIIMMLVLILFSSIFILSYKRQKNKWVKEGKKERERKRNVRLNTSLDNRATNLFILPLLFYSSKIFFVEIRFLFFSSSIFFC